jgi:hypothetical protein
MLSEFCEVTGLDTSQRALLECVVRTAYQEGRIDLLNEQIKRDNNDSIALSDNNGASAH